ncbi:MAG: NTP transferase domain-containing protein [Planctomycetes bacterium]|nr:NTP transferase domain-containing protein [Planctomycetota bacterium]
MDPTLVILAAGLGRRYGGLKQLEPVGPAGATLMDYTVYDAWRAGFCRVIFVIRPEMEAVCRAELSPRYADHIPVDYVFQSLGALPAGCAVPAGRTKPWGTGHAVLAAADAVREPFAVANADDFYGTNALAAVAGFLQSEIAVTEPVFAMVSYSLRDTLAEGGTVARAVCHCTPDGWLARIEEIVGIAREGTNGHCKGPQGEPQILPGDALVSMNLWGFQPVVFEELRSGFREFLQTQGAALDAEFYLPAVIQDAIRARRARVRVLPSEDPWFGITHPEDKPHVTAAIRALVARGVYPEKLWR